MLGFSLTLIAAGAKGIILRFENSQENGPLAGLRLFGGWPQTDSSSPRSEQPQAVPRGGLLASGKERKREREKRKGEKRKGVRNV
jgi:hypothetical protein